MRKRARGRERIEKECVQVFELVLFLHEMFTVDTVDESVY